MQSNYTGSQGCIWGVGNWFLEQQQSLELLECFIMNRKGDTAGTHVWEIQVEEEEVEVEISEKHNRECQDSEKYKATLKEQSFKMEF